MSKKAIEMKDGKPVISLKDIENVRTQALRWVKTMITGCSWYELPFYCMSIASCLKKLGIATEIRVGIDIRGVEYCNILLLYVTGMEMPVEKLKAEFLQKWKESLIVDEFIVLNENVGNAHHVEQLTKFFENACQNLANYVRKQTNVKKTTKQPKTQQQ